jgi:hypothetical protein
MNSDIRFAIALLINRGYAITLWDSADGDGEVELRVSTDANAIFDCLGSTETNRLVLHQKLEDSVWVGKVLRRRRVGELILDWQDDGFDALYDYGAADEEVDHDIRDAFDLIV